MKLFHIILFLYGLAATCCENVDKPDDTSKVDIDKFIAKVLQADRFNDLADRIAERAVNKLKDYQKPTFKAETPKDVNVDPPILRLGEIDKLSKSQSNHKHGNIDINALLKKVVPLNNLKLRYKDLKKMYAKPNLRSKDIPAEENKNMMDYDKLAKDVQSDFNQNIKTMSEEKFSNPFENRGNFDANKVQAVRKEGEKRFAYQESPDYKNYHNNMADMDNPRRDLMY